ncbi:MAG TPA: hypothetical protein VIP70_06690 [Nitrososphaeraceae archaeon]
MPSRKKKEYMNIKEEEQQKEIPRKVIIKMMTTNKSVSEVFDFFANMKNMEIGGAIKSMEKNDDGWWSFNHIIAGKSKMKHILSQKFGILDHVFIGSGLEWHVYVRVIPNQIGSTTTWTFVRPDGLTEEQFEEQLKGFDKEIDGWKNTLES